MNRVLVIGGGLAGLAAAAVLGERGFRVTVLESRTRLGGRAGSFTDAETGLLVDACQHVSMGCCTNLSHFFHTVGVEHYLIPQPKLHFLTPDRRRSVFKADPWPAPVHLGRALFGAHYLTPIEKARVGLGFLALLRESPKADPPLIEWLFKHHQTPRTIDRFWGVVLVSALNESVDRLGFKYARKVFVDGFIRHRDGFVVHVPMVPLGRLYGEELRAWFAMRGVEIRENAAAKQLHVENGRITEVTLRDNSTLLADQYVLAVPHDRVADLLSPSATNGEPYFEKITRLETSPITSVHLWFDRSVMSLPHAVLVDCLGHWVFNRGEIAKGEFYLQVVISASRSLRNWGRDEILQRIVEELNQLFPDARCASLLRSRVVTEHRATFSAVPGVDALRPTQASPITNLVLAGDYTATNWPATMEGAVRSGYLAAEVIVARGGRPERILRPDLA